MATISPAEAALPTSASHTHYSAREAEVGSPSKSLLSGPSKNAATLMAASGGLHLAADPRRSGASECESAHDAARWLGLDAGLAKACEATGSGRMRCGFLWSLCRVHVSFCYGDSSRSPPN